MPVANMITSYIKLSIQFILLVLVAIYLGTEYFNLSSSLLLFPVCLLGIGVLSTAIGVMVSALTTKYRDLKFLLQFGIQLLMYASAVVWPLPLLEKMSKGDNEWIYELSLYNPLIHFIEGFRYTLFGEGYFDPMWFAYSCIITVVLLLIGLILFSRTEKDFMDTI
jgi:lipopolysaccharide transport system permease protein